MEFRCGWRWAAVIVLLCASGIAEVGGDGKVRVFVYDNAGATLPVLEQAAGEAVRIFRAAGIELQWLNCSSRSHGAECPNLTVKDLVIHVVPRGKIASESVYGDAFLGEDGTGRYADIFFDRVREAHRADGASEGRLLGTVAAHEIGHLLLGRGAHTWFGIMAPRWSPEQIRQMEMGRLLFTPGQGDRMRERRNNVGWAKTYTSEGDYASGKLQLFPAGHLSADQPPLPLQTLASDTSSDCEMIGHPRTRVAFLPP
jgi:hypothetical protein